MQGIGLFSIKHYHMTKSDTNGYQYGRLGANSGFLIPGYQIRNPKPNKTDLPASSCYHINRCQKVCSSNQLNDVYGSVKFVKLVHEP
jgi:hypothetical protein